MLYCIEITTTLLNKKIAAQIATKNGESPAQTNFKSGWPQKMTYKSNFTFKAPGNDIVHHLVVFYRFMITYKVIVVANSVDKILRSIIKTQRRTTFLTN